MNWHLRQSKYFKALDKRTIDSYNANIGYQLLANEIASGGWKI